MEEVNHCVNCSRLEQELLYIKSSNFRQVASRDRQIKNLKLKIATILDQSTLKTTYNAKIKLYTSLLLKRKKEIDQLKKTVKELGKKIDHSAKRMDF